MSEWMPIDTAPRDGTRVLLATPTGKCADGMFSVRYGVWSWPYVMAEPTHWMIAPPIPQKAPNAIGQRGAACGASAAPTGCASNGSEKEE